ncbi:MAG TPA: serine hydrolase [Bacillota bacterium]|nr:serine hydrolase [Bacillota bacterium]
MRPHKSRRIAAGIVALILIAFVGIGAGNGLRAIPVVAASVNTLPRVAGSADIGWPAKGEAAVSALEYGSLGEHGGNTPLPTASIAKVITSLAVLQKSPLQAGEQGPSYTVTEADVASYNDYVARDGSVVTVTLGEQITEYQALQALMLPSANNIADSLTVWVFGSFANYKTYAAQMLGTLGMKDTVIGSDASGLAPDTVSTPSDLIKLGTAVLNHPVLSQIVAQTSASLPVAGTVHNVDWLLGSHGVIGVKTGNSDEAGGCFLFASKHQIGPKTITLVGAVMGANDLNGALSSSAALIDSAASTFSYVTPITKSQEIATYKLPWGGTATAVAKNDMSFVRWSGADVSSQATFSTVHTSLPSGSNLGTLTITNGTHAHKIAVVAKTAIPGPSFWWRVTRH